MRLTRHPEPFDQDAHHGGGQEVHRCTEEARGAYPKIAPDLDTWRGGLSQYGRVQVPAVQTQAEPQAEPEPAKKRTKKRAASDRAIQNPQKKAKVAEVVDAGCVSLV